MIAARPPRIELERESLDSIRCPKGCGGFLEFRSDPMSGRTQERCWRCDRAWRFVVPRYPDKPSHEARPELGFRRDGRSVMARAARRHFSHAAEAATREAIPIGESRAVTRAAVLASVPYSRALVDRILRQLRRSGAVRCERRSRSLFVWQVAS